MSLRDSGTPRRRGAQRRLTGLAVGITLLGATMGLGCNDSPTPPVDSFRFAQVGSVRITVVTPLQLGAGEIQQILNWDSDGPWTLREEISYGDLIGDATEVRNDGQDSSYALSYASLITLLNDNEALSLFIPTLDPDLEVECGSIQSSVTVRMRDDLRGEEISWIRCDTGTLQELTPVGAGPDNDAARVIQAAILTRDLSLGEVWSSEYLGSFPFGTLDRGEDSGIRGLEAQVFRNGLTVAPSGTEGVPWAEFWASHAGEGSPVPEVDWERDIVIVAADGIRQEAGDSIEVRRVVEVISGSQIEVVERVPGDFCSPASRIQTPFHIVLTPRIPSPVRFSNLRVERVPCGT